MNEITTDKEINPTQLSYELGGVGLRVIGPEAVMEDVTEEVMVDVLDEDGAVVGQAPTDEVVVIGQRPTGEHVWKVKGDVAADDIEKAVRKHKVDKKWKHPHPTEHPKPEPPLTDDEIKTLRALAKQV